jgi:HEPN domain-containing protein/predicted nucleotidyltransferase
MVKRIDIEHLGRAIGDQFHPRRVILFGSYARGAATEDSDVDIFVEMDHAGREVDAAVDIRMKTRPRFPVDILVRSPKKIGERLRMGDTFVKDILDHGATLYEATNWRMGWQAEGDFATVLREFRARKNPNYDGLCFHAQQCAEKYLKACLSETGIPFGKTHDLNALLDQVLPIEPTWESFRRSLAYLSEYSVSFRYPGESADRESACDAYQRCRAFRKTARESLSAPDE